ERQDGVKGAVAQALLLRGSRDFADRAAYTTFVRQLLAQRNRGRQQRLAEERPYLRPLPATRWDACKRLRVKVTSGSTIQVDKNTYSVPSRLIGAWVEARVSAAAVEGWYAQQLVETLPRLRGQGKHRIHYRHVLDWLVRKPGAFARYRFRADLFPSSQFRLAYDQLLGRQPERAAKEYLAILQLAARESEAGVAAALRQLLEGSRPLSAAAVADLVRQGRAGAPVTAGQGGAV